MMNAQKWWFAAPVMGLAAMGVLHATASMFGPEWVEDGDAGSTVQTAQRTTGAGPLNSIVGKLEGLESSRGVPDLEDLYIVQIDDTESFFAGLFSTCFVGRIFLFDMDGFGLLGAEADDYYRGGKGGGAIIFGEGEDLPGPGEYILAITVRDRQPFSESGPIFDLPPFGQSGANGVGANDPLAFWDGIPDEADCGDYEVDLGGTSLVPPGNNDCFNAEPIGIVTDQFFSTEGATGDSSACTPMSNSIWYEFTAPCNGEVFVDLCGSFFDTMLAVYDGASCDPLPPLLACNNMAPATCGDGSMQSAATFQAVQGNTYLIEVGGFEGITGIGDITIEMDCVDGCEFPGRPDPDGTSDRVIRGYVLAWAVNDENQQIRWNHLSGAATVVDYRSGAAWEHGAWAAPVMQDAVGHGQPVGTPGQIKLDGIEYAAAYDQLLFNFQAPGSAAYAIEGIGISIDSDLTLHILEADLRQDNDGPITTLAQVDVWNMNETKFSNTRRCLTCWDEVLLSQFSDQPNNFLLSNLQTTHGKARIDGIALTECESSSDAALLGVASQTLGSVGIRGGDLPRGSTMMGGTNLFGMGVQEALIQYDVLEAPPESASSQTDERRPRRPSVQSDASDLVQRGAVIDAGRRGSVFEKGSLVVLSKVEIKFDETGALIQDTFIQLTNDHSDDVIVQMMFVNGDDPIFEETPFGGCIRPGWNWVDVEFTLTGNQSTYWSARSGLPAGFSPWTILDP